MLLELKNDKPNFSKIGKYISNKLHHIHKEGSSRIPKKRFVREKSHEGQQTASKSQVKVLTKNQKENAGISKKRNIAMIEPTVGTYRVNYSIVDKNVHQYNFSRSTPHFFGIKPHINQTTNCYKNYPDGLEQKQKGLTELKRMVGRDQIKGNIRKNLQNPHENRFCVQKFPVLSPRAGLVHFDKMSPRKQNFQSLGLTLPQYDYDYQINMKRLDSHIITFEKQIKRDDGYLKQSATSEDYRCLDQFKLSPLSKNVQWNKQLPRQVQGMLPTYMDKTVNSRMALSLINLKTLQMNCTDLKPTQKKATNSRKLKFKKKTEGEYFQQKVE